jgi:predicted house-cleaning noncanonical NTP pyrophosphatase (MazG superfamily)
MKFRKFKQHKLWRDKAVDNLESLGSKVHWTTLNNQDFADQLKLKFMEEAQEVYSAQTREALMEELADILEVISSLSDVHQFTLEDIIALQHKKHQERGGFRGRKFVTVAEHPVGSFGEKYCLADPEKYPEV